MILLGVPAIDEIWQAIDYEVMWLHGRWSIYRQLYGTNEGRIEILNHSAGTFASMLQDVLLDDVQLGLAKLGDPATSRIKGGTVVANLTLENLCQSVIATGSLQAKLPPLLSAYNAACADVRDRRNKRIAHFDLHTMLGSNVSISGPSRAEIEAALAVLRDIMNCIFLHFTNSQTGYEHIVLDSDGDSLIAVLRRGLRYQDLVIDGAISSDDLRSSKWGKD